tara:strand:+ start:2911 stop:4311 length:1401 start_codon:yes stop_codon:yes gene_type:complete
MKSNLKGLEPVILAGGFGKRLWPISGPNKPKQFHSFVGKYSLFQDTLVRLKKIGFESVTVITNRENFLLAEYQAKDIEINCDFICEPESKNTAPALAIAAILFEEQNKTLFVLPSDHAISVDSSFIKTIAAASRSTAEGNIALLGVKTKEASTSYGYINVESNRTKEKKVKRFIEKPNVKTARKFHKSPNYYWNSGIFLIKPKVYLSELSKHCPKIYKSVKSSFSLVKEKVLIDPEKYSKCPGDSIDYAVLENSKKSVLFNLDSAWSDLGSWEEIYKASKKDAKKNVTRGDIFLMDTSNSLIFSEENPLAVIGLNEVVILNTNDALVVSSIDGIKNITTLIKKLERGNSKLLHNSEVLKPWGNYKIILLEDGFQVKKLTINPGHQLSLQRHKFRSEHWNVVSGKGQVIKNKKKFIIEKDQSIYFAKEDIHSISNPFSEDLIIIEVQLGGYLGEDDIERLEDVYDRS